MGMHGVCELFLLIVGPFAGGEYGRYQSRPIVNFYG
jgi:hypothetical protein